MGASGGVKLLLDENLSRRIVPALQEAFPGSAQAVLAGLERADDRTMWEYAKKEGFTIVTKDDDFLGLLALLGYPPKVVLLTLGNCANQQVVDAPRDRRPPPEKKRAVATPLHRAAMAS